MNEQTYRTFLALPLAEYFHHELVRFLGHVKYKVAGVKWVLPQQVHITLHFFGQTTEYQLRQIEEITSSLTKQYPPLRIGLDAVGAFPDFNRPRVIWLGITGDSEKLIQLQTQIEKALGQAGFKLENRRFRPHATLGRVKQAVRLKSTGGEPYRRLTVQDLPYIQTDIAFIDKIILFQSHLSQEGSRYEILKTFPFAPTTPP